jgi:hypothetical protein
MKARDLAILLWDRRDAEVWVQSAEGVLMQVDGAYYVRDDDGKVVEMILVGGKEKSEENR